MSRLLLGAGLSLVLFLAAYVAAAVVVAAASLRRRPDFPAPRAGFFLALRLAPTASAILLALLAALAFALHEPAESGERLGPVLLASALLGAGLVASGLWRALAALFATRRLVRAWRDGARRLHLPDVPAPVYRIDHTFPVVAAVGIFRARLFLARSVVDRLSPAELRAVLAHEAAHLQRRDNLKRWLIRCCPPVPTGWGERLSREWEAASEAAADERAAGRDRRAARHLASALVKVARLSPPGARLSASAVALLSEGDLGGRVERLLTERECPSVPPPPGVTLVVLAAAALGLTLATLPQTLRVLHGLLETLVQTLG